MSRVVADMNQSRHYASHCITVMLHPCVKLHPYVMLHPYVKLHPYPVMLHGYIISHPSIMLHPYVMLHRYVIMLHGHVISHCCMDMSYCICKEGLCHVASICHHVAWICHIDKSYRIHQGGTFCSKKRHATYIQRVLSHTWMILLHLWGVRVTNINKSFYTYWNVAPLIFWRTHITHFQIRSLCLFLTHIRWHYMRACYDDAVLLCTWLILLT